MKRPPANRPFQQLIEAHADAVARFLRGMLPARDVDDAVQETFLAALRGYPDFDGTNPRAWLLTIARNKAIDEYRGSGRRPGNLAEPDEIASAGTADDGADGAIWIEVAALPPKQRAGIVLRFALDLRYREVGEALGCSEEAARRNVYEAIRNLRAGIAGRSGRANQPEVTR